MGNSVSCFDPVREHPPYSWPKDHPGREAAIAEKKRQRRQQKIAVLKGNTTDVSKESAKDVKVAKIEAGTSQEHISEDATGEYPQRGTSQEGRKEASTPTEHNLGTSERKESDGLVITEEANIPPEGESPAELSPEDFVREVGTAIANDGNCVPEEGVLGDADEHQERGNGGPDILPFTSGGTPNDLLTTLGETDGLLGDGSSDSGDENCIESGKNDTEGAKLDEGSIEVLGEHDTDESKSPRKLEEECEITRTERPIDKAPTREESMHTVTPFDNRRAQFEDGDSELPEPREVTRDVLDPVTGELISLAEYRVRQMARAEGLVKERVGQYENVVDERAKEMAKQAAIEAVRNEVMEKHQWRFKNEKGVVQKQSAEDDAIANHEAPLRSLSHASGDVRTESE
eukprot:GFKZ01001303.1.p1 GENE.GFKZ01001303.1~~GFKZ01001303.1.p1  ORF type:complete len:402 (-),score=74.48 GFKZ01001303.1:1068-2273(-)